MKPGGSTPGVRSRTAATVALYGALVVALTWPLAAHIRTHLPDSAPAARVDTVYMAWILSHESHALATGGALADANGFALTRGTLFYGDTGFGALPLFMPVYLLTGNPALGINVVILAGLVLTAAALHLVVHRWTGSYPAGLVAGCVLLTSRFVVWEFTPGAPAYALLQYFPFIILLASEPARGWRDALRLLPLVVLQCLSDVVYLAAAVLAPLGLLAVGRSIRPSTRAAGARLLAMLAIAFAILLPIYAAYWSVQRANPTLAAQTGWRPAWPTMLPWGPFTGTPRPLALPRVVWVVIAAGIASFLLRPQERAWRPWLHASLWACTGLYLSITPTASWNGTPIVLPHAGLEDILGLTSVLRVPYRLGLAGLMGVALLAGLACDACLQWIPGRGRRFVGPLVALVLVGAMYDGMRSCVPAMVPGAYPLAPVLRGDSAIVRALRRGTGPVVELPIGLFRGGVPDLQMRALYRSTYHWRPVLNGYSSYWPVGFPERVTTIARLPARDAVEALERETDLQTIVVRLADFGGVQRSACHFLHGEHAAECEADFGLPERLPWETLLAEGGRDDLRLVAREGDEEVFQVLSRDPTVRLTQLRRIGEIMAP